ncbi:MAG: SusC/RagA family TonB-linked outer membrane protein [Prevotella sp.]|nr:SusC/RagA family TonB-linked outer membrane protein [Prevotella sp.]
MKKVKRCNVFSKGLIMLILMIFAINSYALKPADTKMSVNVNSVPVEQVLREVHNKAKIDFVYDAELSKNWPKISLHANNKSAEEIIRQLSGMLNCDYSIKGNIVTLTQQQMSGKDRTVKGVVKDDAGNLLIGVPVCIGESRVCTVTDEDGYYTFKIPVERTTLKFSYVGMDTKYVTIPAGTTAVTQNIILQSGHQLDEVVVTGYQTMSKRESASSIYSVKAEDIMVEGAANIDQMLQGRVPGMAVMMTSGEPSATPKIRIRGNATINGNKSPVWVVDGVILEQDVPFSASDINSEDAEYLIGNAISGLNPQDIETITVLKDASATAIYGVKAANGVIVITTKKGSTGRPIVTYNGDVTLNTRPSYSNYDIMNSQERVAFSKMLVEKGLTSGRFPVGETYEGIYEQYLAKNLSSSEYADAINALQVRNTDWFKTLFRNNITHTHSANISGGGNNVRYYMSAGFSDVQASARNSSSRKFNTLAKIDANLNSFIRMQAKIAYSTTYNRGYHSSINPFNYAYGTSRTLPLYNEDGTYHKIYRASNTLGSSQNIGYNVLEELDKTGQDSHMDNFDAQLALNVKIVKGLEYQGTFSWSQANTNTRNWAEEQSYYIGANYRMYDYGLYTPYDAEYFDSRLPYGGILTQGSIRRTGYTIRNQMQYRETFGSHHINLIGGVEARRNAYKGVTVTGYGWTPEYGEKFNPVLTEKYKSGILDAGLTNPLNTNSFTQVASFYGIASYGYLDRYILNFNIRSDGSNKFGSNPKYRWLPTYSFAVKWNIDQEPFMKSQTWIDNLAIRASYGIQGNISENSSPYLVLQVGNRDNILSLPTSRFYRYPNPDLRWEKTHSWNVALDFSFLKGRIRGGFDVYSKRTKDLIINKTLAASSGTTSMAYNAGKMNNKGFEGFVNVGIIREKDWEWRVGVNFGRNVNEIIYANNEALTSNEVQQAMLSGNMAIEGAPIGSLYAYHFAGVNQDIGLPMHYTKDGKASLHGALLDMELIRTGSIFPKLAGGFDTQLIYKNWSLGLNFAYNIGAVSRLPSYYTSGQYNADPQSNVSREWLNSWKQAGDNTTFPGVYDYKISNNYLASEKGSAYDTYDDTIGGTVIYPYQMYNQSDVRVASTDFLKLKMVSLSYSFPKKMLTPLHVSSLRLRLQATNLFTFCNSDWHGLDPETAGVGIPQLPSYSLSVNVSF